MSTGHGTPLGAGPNFQRETQNWKSPYWDPVRKHLQIESERAKCGEGAVLARVCAASLWRRKRVLMDSCGHAAVLLRLGAHNRHMEPAKPQKVVLIVLAAILLCGWALIIWIATIVTQTMLETLSYIVDLAGMTP
jgi:hypothetical protein